MRWSMLPVSICVHVLAGIACLIVPLAAEDEWPTPAPLRSLVVAMKAVPVAAPVTPPAPRHAPAVSVIAPAEIGPERDVHVEPVGPIVTGVPLDGAIGLADGGVPNGVGTPIALPAPPLAPATPPSPKVPVRAGHGVRAPKKIVDVRPVYPVLAQTSRIEGVVILEAVINERGRVERVRVLRSVPLLDSAAVDAVTAWRYTPTLLNGVPVAVLMTITINFTLHD